MEELGRGATARAVLARHSSSGAKVCLKIFHPSLLQDSRAKQRVLSEIKLSQSLSHPNIVSVEEVIATEPPVLVMTFVEGQNLEKFQSRLPYVLPEVSALVVREIARGLHHAHTKGIVHRDLKPENVLVSNQGGIFITDFGLAKVVDSNSTATNGIVGSLHYLSPEQVRGDRVDAATDIFALGSIFYYLTTGTRPFLRSTLPATLDAIRTSQIAAPREQNPKVSLELSRIIEKALAKDPSGRYSDAKQFETAITNYLESLGLTEDKFSFQLWSQSPNTETIEALRIAADHLERRCETLFNARNKTGLLESLSHLSLKAPGSAVLSRLSAGSVSLRSKRSPLHVAGFGTVVLLICTLGFVYWWRSAPIESEVAPTQTISSAPTQVPQQQEQPLEPAKGVVEKVKRAFKPSQAKSNVEAPKPVVAPIEGGTVIFSLPHDAEVFWDFRRVYDGTVLRDQALKRHTLIVNRPGHDLQRSEINVTAGEPVKVNIHD